MLQRLDHDQPLRLIDTRAPSCPIDALSLTSCNSLTWPQWHSPAPALRSSRSVLNTMGAAPSVLRVKLQQHTAADFIISCAVDWAPGEPPAPTRYDQLGCSSAVDTGSVDYKQSSSEFAMHMRPIEPEKLPETQPHIRVHVPRPVRLGGSVIREPVPRPPAPEPLPTQLIQPSAFRPCCPRPATHHEAHMKFSDAHGQSQDVLWRAVAWAVDRVRQQEALMVERSALQEQVRGLERQNARACSQLVALADAWRCERQRRQAAERQSSLLRRELQDMKAFLRRVVAEDQRELERIRARCPWPRVPV